MTILVALDRASVRRVDENGFLHVEMSNISKANVCGYFGQEIPGWRDMGLDPNREYQLYRDPEELTRAAPSFNNLFLLSEHLPVMPEELPKELIIGSTGTDATFEAPYLKNSLVVQDAAYIDAIGAGRQRELSCGYRYRADMSPGVTPEGLQYDGVMRDIIGNHVALVIEGRAGPDVVVGDEVMKLKSRTALMISGALQSHIRPLLAADAKVDIAPALADVTSASMAADGAPKELAAKIAKLVKPHLAADASLDADALAGYIASITPLAMDEDKIDELAGDEDEDDDDKTANDEDPDAKEKGDGDDLCEDGDDEDDDKKPAMDSATVKKLIAAAEQRGAARTAAIEVAKRDVMPHVGEVIGMDSAEAIYGFALKSKGVDTKGVPASAFKAMVKMLPTDKPMATDSRPAFGEGKLAKMFPDLPALIRS
jgi:hypothetical protein